MHAPPMRRLFVSSLVLAVSACGEPAPKREWKPSDHGQPRVEAADDNARAPEAADTTEDANVRAARALFIAACSGCHGRDGRGQGESRPPGAKVPDFTDASFQNSRTDAQL